MKKKKDSIIIPKKALLGISFTVPIIGVLLSKRQPGPLLLFLIGAGLGIFIGFNFKKRRK